MVSSYPQFVQASFELMQTKWVSSHYNEKGLLMVAESGETRFRQANTRYVFLGKPLLRNVVVIHQAYPTLGRANTATVR